LQRYAPPLQPSFIHLSKSLVYYPPPTYQVPVGWKGPPHGVSLIPFHTMVGTQHSAHCYSNFLRVSVRAF
jgi:hypothetical protein